MATLKMKSDPKFLLRKLKTFKSEFWFSGFPKKTSQGCQISEGALWIFLDFLFLWSVGSTNKYPTISFDGDWSWTCDMFSSYVILIIHGRALNEVYAKRPQEQFERLHEYTHLSRSGRRFDLSWRWKFQQNMKIRCWGFHKIHERKKSVEGPSLNMFKF